MTWTVEAYEFERIVVVRFAGMFTANVSLGATPLLPLEQNHTAAVFGIAPKEGGSLTITPYADGLPVVYSVTVNPRAYKGSPSNDHATYLADLKSACCVNVDSDSCTILDNPNAFCVSGANSCDIEGLIVDIVLPGLQCTNGLPDSLTGIETLETLDLSRSGIQQPASDLFKLLFNMVSLRHLILPSNNITGKLPAAETVSQWLGADGTPLVTLDLSNNDISGPLPTIFFGTDTMAHINVAHNKFSGSVPQSVDSAPLRVVDLSDNLFTDSAGNTFTDNPLLYLDVSNNNLTFLMPGTNPKTIVYYDIHNNSLALSTFPSNTQRLVYMDISSNILTNGYIDSLVPSAAAGSYLAVFKASSSQLIGEVPASLAALPSIRHIDVSDNKLTGDLSGFGTGLSATNAITYFNASQNTLQDGIPDTLKKLAVFSTKELPPQTVFHTSMPPQQVATERVFDVSGNPFLKGAYPVWMANAASEIAKSAQASGVPAARVVAFNTEGAGLECPTSANDLTMDAAGVIAIQSLNLSCTNASSKAEIGVNDALFKLVPGIPAPPPPPTMIISRAPSKSNKTWKAVGITLGCLFAVALIAAGVFAYKWRDLDLKLKQRYHKQTGDEFQQNYVVSPRAGDDVAKDVEMGGPKSP